MDVRRPGPPDGVERRAPEPFLFTPGQLLGRDTIRLRRRRDKQRLAAHLAAAALMVGLTLWWVLPVHAFAGPVVLRLTSTHGVHVGDLPSLLFLAVAARSALAVARLLQPPAATSLAQR